MHSRLWQEGRPVISSASAQISLLQRPSMGPHCTVFNNPYVPTAPQGPHGFPPQHIQQSFQEQHVANPWNSSWDAPNCYHPSTGQGGNHVIPGASEQMSLLQKPRMESQCTQVNTPYFPIAPHGPPVCPPQQIQPHHHQQPAYNPQYGSWGAPRMNYHQTAYQGGNHVIPGAHRQMSQPQKLRMESHCTHIRPNGPHNVMAANNGISAQYSHPHSSAGPIYGCTGVPEGGHVIPGAPQQMWLPVMPDMGLHGQQGSTPCGPAATKALPVPPAQQVQPFTYQRPVYRPRTSSLVAPGLNVHLMTNQTSSSGPPTIRTTNHGIVVQGANLHRSSRPVQSCVDPQKSPEKKKNDDSKELPQKRKFDGSNSCMASGPSEGGLCRSPEYKWQGLLSKSGVHYCKLSACRVHSDICQYLDVVSEPNGWPSILEITLRTDLKHVMSRFTNTPLYTREVCLLIPSSADDQKGFQDIVSYLKQRECAGIIEIPATSSVWRRLIFLLPYSLETCSMLGITPNPPDGLIALVLPKRKKISCECSSHSTYEPGAVQNLSIKVDDSSSMSDDMGKYSCQASVSDIYSAFYGLVPVQVQLLSTLST